MKNKLISKFVFMFVIGISLLFSCSDAIPAGTPFSIIMNSYENYIPANSELVPGYTSGDVYNILKNYRSNSDNVAYKETLETMLSVFDDNGKKYVLLDKTRLLFCDADSDIDLCFYLERNYTSGRAGGYFNNSSGRFYLAGVYDSTIPMSYKSGYAGSYNTTIMVNTSTVIEYANTDFYLITYSSESNVSWDGESYFYKAVTEPEGPALPSNEEIASVTQKFYESDFYKNNKNFSDFFVVYYAHNQTFAFIGHTVKDDLGQVIVPPGVREQGKVYDEQWWHFFVDENAGAPPYGTTFYLYTTTDFGETFVDDGTGVISDLVNVDFSKNAIIVYSTTDYLVRTYVLDETSGETTYTDGIIEGDQYTYDENLDPTENYYNPLDNFGAVNTTISETPWTRFLSMIQSIPEKIFAAFGNMTGLTKILTFVTPLVSAILIILNVLLSSISFLARAVTFVYTLPTIQASDALFLVDVDSTTGLVFTGNSWGIKFLEGLNMVKEFSWNGLNLWTLFTSFIVAIFAIHCIKLVRKHYHY